MNTSTCVICSTSWDPSFKIRDKLNNEEEERNEVDRKKVLLDNFCNNFEIPLSIKQLEFNFHQDDLPFCSSCQDKGELLVKHGQQLDTLKSAVSRVENLIKGQIQSSRNAESSNQLSDGRVNIIREMVLARIKTLPNVQSTLTEFEINEDEIEMDDFNDDSIDDVQNNVDPLQTVMSDNEDNSMKDDSFFNIFSSDQSSDDDQPAHVKQPKKMENPTNSRKASNPKKIELRNDSSESPDSSTDEEKPSRNKNDSDYEPPEAKKVELNTRKRIRGSYFKDREKKNIHILKVAGKPDTYSYGGFEFHMNEDNRFRCSGCPEMTISYARKYGVIWHIRQEHIKEQKVHLCETCGRDFHRSNDLRKHALSHDPGARVLCHLCGGSYKNPLLLARHVAVIHSRDEIRCEYDNCTRVFVSRRKYLRHVRSEHKDIPRELLPEAIIYCPFCDCSFVRKGRLKSHIRIYHNDGTGPVTVKPQAAPSAERKRIIFRRKDQAATSNPEIPKRRRNRQKKPRPDFYKCPTCGVQYRRASSLRKHQVTVHNEQLKWRWRVLPNDDNNQDNDNDNELC